MMTYETGGVGRKPCTCGIFLPARAAECPDCGYDFLARPATIAGRVSAERSRAESVVGSLSTSTQTTSTQTTPRSSPSKPSLPAPTPSPDKRHVLLTPAGPCPVQLKGTDFESVQVWVERLVRAVPEMTLSTSAIIYWARQFHGVFSAEYQTIAGHVLTVARAPTATRLGKDASARASAYEHEAPLLYEG